MDLWPSWHSFLGDNSPQTASNAIEGNDIGGEATGLTGFSQRPHRHHRQPVNLIEQAVKYFMEAGGLDREAAEGEAAGAASSPTQKIHYITGKWQIMRLLGKYRDQKGKDFRLGRFHDESIANGSLPLSVIEWILLNDSSSLDEALK